VDLILCRLKPTTQVGGFANGIIKPGMVAYHLHVVQLQCSCLEHLVQYNGDLLVKSFSCVMEDL